MNLNISPAHFDMDQIDVDHDQYCNPFGPNHVFSSSSSPMSPRVFFNLTDHQDHSAGYYDHHLYEPQYHQEGEPNYAYHGGSLYAVKNTIESGLNLTLWKQDQDIVPQNESDNNNLEKYMPTKKMTPIRKNPDRLTLKIITSAITKIDDDQKLQPSVSPETDFSSSGSYNNIHMNSQIRVCSDCNTTKTPLWRSGPQGPKSLCNACGIRQRKARRAAAIGNGGPPATSQPPANKIKVKHKEKKIRKNVQASKFKKSCKIASGHTVTSADGPQSSGHKKLDLEDFLINLSENLSFQLQLFPEEEKDAAILLMALSSGLVHG